MGENRNMGGKQELDTLSFFFQIQSPVQGPVNILGYPRNREDKATGIQDDRTNRQEDMTNRQDDTISRQDDTENRHRVIFDPDTAS